MATTAEQIETADVAVGAIVEYHGSIANRHGRYHVEQNTGGRYTLRRCRPNDGLLPATLCDVRRESFTVIDDCGLCVCDA